MADDSNRFGNNRPNSQNPNSNPYQQNTSNPYNRPNQNATNPYGRPNVSSQNPYARPNTPNAPNQQQYGRPATPNTAQNPYARPTGASNLNTNQRYGSPNQSVGANPYGQTRPTTPNVSNNMNRPNTPTGSPYNSQVGASSNPYGRPNTAGNNAGQNPYARPTGASNLNTNQRYGAPNQSVGANPYGQTPQNSQNNPYARPSASGVGQNINGAQQKYGTPNQQVGGQNPYGQQGRPNPNMPYGQSQPNMPNMPYGNANRPVSAPQQNVAPSKEELQRDAQTKSLQRMQSHANAQLKEQEDYDKRKRLLLLLLLLLFLILLGVGTYFFFKNMSSGSQNTTIRMSMQIDNKDLLSVKLDSGELVPRTIYPGDQVALSAMVRNADSAVGDPVEPANNIPPNIYVRFKITLIIDGVEYDNFVKPTCSTDWITYNQQTEENFYGGVISESDNYYYLNHALAFNNMVGLFYAITFVGDQITCEYGGQSAELIISIDCITADYSAINDEGAWSSAPREWVHAIAVSEGI